MTEKKALQIGRFLVGAPEERLQIKRLMIECVPNAITMDHEAVRQEFGDAIATKLLPYYRTEGKRYEIDHEDQIIRREFQPGYDSIPAYLYNELLLAIRAKATIDGSVDKNLTLNEYGMFEMED